MACSCGGSAVGSLVAGTPAGALYAGVSPAALAFAAFCMVAALLTLVTEREHAGRKRVGPESMTDREPQTDEGGAAPPPAAGSGERCPECDGTGRRDGRECPACEGTGNVMHGLGGG